MIGGDPWVRTMDGSVTPIQLRKKALHSDVAVCGFQGFLMAACLFIYLCSLAFFERALFALRLRYALPFMARFPATHDG